MPAVIGMRDSTGGLRLNTLERSHQSLVSIYCTPLPFLLSQSVCDLKIAIRLSTAVEQVSTQAFFSLLSCESVQKCRF